MIYQVHCDEHPLESGHATDYYQADISYSYKDSKKHKLVTDDIRGKFRSGTQPVKAKISGKLVHITSLSKKDRSKTNHFGCEKYTTKLPSVKWIALVERGECKFTKKLHMATIDHNASAVVIYDNETLQRTFMTHEDVKKNVAVLIAKDEGLKLAKLLDKGVSVKMDIRRGQRVLSSDSGNMNNSSVLFVSISFIIIVIISVAWLMFYYIRKFRYSHAKERLAKRLARAAKKAIAKIPQRTISVGDKELEGDFDQCAICIEPYKDGDIIRLMPCRHVFHKSCVDPWLLDHRTCPMCKLDILQAFGMSMCKLDMLAYGMQSSQESMHRDMEAGAVMIETIPSGDGGGRSESTALVLDDNGASSSLEDETPDNPEVKVVLVPHSCLHYHHHSSMAGQEDVFEEDDEEDAESEASTGLLAGSSTGSCAHKSNRDVSSGSTGSLDFAVGGKHNPGRGKSQGRPVGHKDDMNKCEMEALIHPSGIEREHDDSDKEVENREHFIQESSLAKDLDGNNSREVKDEPHLNPTGETKSAFPPVINSSDDLHLRMESRASPELIANAKQSKV
ncbi:E3 ubiquitin-protein ligase RNF130 [Elysia marginata]|uniref:E3 ubiquitin-protein ligase RNF130 n=1 Tax=Elysia marginata TaxID=1093978 RepID=A0AAV4IY97_9GAST|nr:E3 ubiquitin-protein ligase RNF130 [Elysia marginata]